MNNFYQNNFKSIIGIILLFVGTFFNNVHAQTIISTESGTNYNVSTFAGTGSNAVITFVIENTNAAPITLRGIDTYFETTSSGLIPTLWYSATSLSGAPNVASPTWTSITTGPAVTVAANGILPVLTGLSFVIPANTQYRFALQSSNNLFYRNNGAPTPTPTTLSAAGVNLKLGSAQVAGAVVGFAGVAPAPTFNPRFFVGRIKFDAPASTPPSCAANLAPVNNTVDVLPNGTLTWNAAATATSYDVYLGTTVNPPLVGNVTTTSYSFSALTLNTLYFYKIVPKNAAGAATGCATNAFTTIAVFCNLPSTFTTSPDTAFCGTDPVTLSVRTGTLNDATQYSWYTGSCGGTLIGTGRSISVNPATTTSYYVRPDGGCVGSTGACSTIVITKITSINSPIINPSNAICLGSVATLSINPTTVLTDSVYVESSPTLSIPVPDNISTGVSTTLTVPAGPVGYSVSGIEVTLTMSHTYPGDMIFNLKAPNGNILNLYKYGTGLFTGPGAIATGAGWVNTIISSAGTRAFSSVNAAPFAYGSGPYRADAINAPVTGPTVQNPDGFVSNVTNFTNLYSVPAGTWTLAMADGGPADLGTLTRWTIKVRYSSTPTPALPAVWSPASTLYTNAAATIPYDGTTPRFTVFAKPSTTTIYSAVAGSGSCASIPATIQQVVSIPASLQPVLTQKTICEFDESFITVPFTGNRPSFQWYAVDTNNVTRLLNNSDTFSGVTSDTLFFKKLSEAKYNNSRYYCKIVAALPCLSTNGIDSTLKILLKINPTPTVELTSYVKNSLLPGQFGFINAVTNPQAVNYNWFNNDAAIFGSNGPTYNFAIDSLGSYKLAIVDINGCKNTSKELEIIAENSSKLFIYPNPNNGNFQVRFYSSKGNKAVRTMLVYDSKGALVYNKTYTTANPYGRMDVDFKNFTRGIYVISLLDAGGKRLASGKVSVN